jgi:hypothetical protein
MIHFFGDSFTFCQGCTPEHEYYKRTYDGTQKTWIKLISEYQNDNYKNYGIPGVGNQKIIDSVIENIKNIKSGDMVFLSRTHDERLQMPHNNHFIDILPGMYKLEYEDDEADYYKTIEDYVKFILFPHFEGVTNRYDRLFSNITQYFESIDVKCIRWDVENHTIKDGQAIYSIISDEYPDIKDSHWSWTGHKSFFEGIKTLL